MDQVFDFRHTLPEDDDIPITYMHFPYAMHLACAYQDINHLSQFEGVEADKLMHVRGMGSGRWKQCVEELRKYHFELDSTGVFRYTGPAEIQPYTPLPPKQDQPIEVLDLNRTACAHFKKRWNIQMISDFVGVSYYELATLRGIGQPAIETALSGLKNTASDSGVRTKSWTK